MLDSRGQKLDHDCPPSLQPENRNQHQSSLYIGIGLARVGLPRAIIYLTEVSGSHGVMSHLYCSCTVDTKKLEYGCRAIYAGVISVFCLGSEDGHIPTSELLL